MKWTNWIQEENETLLDLIFGCLAYSLLLEIIGLLMVPNKGSYTVGLFLGTAVAIGLGVNMAKGLEKCLAMEQSKARRSMTVRSMLRLLVMLVAALAGIKCKAISFPGVIIGILGLKISAQLHMYTNLYITKKIRRKGR